MKLWMTMGLALVSTLLVAGCTMPSSPTAQGQGTPAPQPDYGSKAYGY
jgi:hypothetical protein